MLVSCPNCKATFAVPAKAIGATGRKLKCSKCTHIWHQAPVEFENKLNNILQTEFTESNNLPAKIKPKLKLLYVASFVVMLILISVLQIIKNPSSIPAAATAISLQNFEGLRFNNVSVNSELVDKKLDFYISGEIINVSDKKVKIPPVKLVIYSKGNRVMSEANIDVGKEFLEPFEVFPIKPEITRVSGNAANIELSFENWAESTFR